MMFTTWSWRQPESAEGENMRKTIIISLLVTLASSAGVLADGPFHASANNEDGGTFLFGFEPFGDPIGYIWSGGKNAVTNTGEWAANNAGGLTLAAIAGIFGVSEDAQEFGQDAIDFIFNRDSYTKTDRLKEQMRGSKLPKNIPQYASPFNPDSVNNLAIFGDGNTATLINKPVDGVLIYGSDNVLELIYEAPQLPDPEDLAGEVEK